MHRCQFRDLKGSSETFYRGRKRSVFLQREIQSTYVSDLCPSFILRYLCIISSQNFLPSFRSPLAFFSLLTFPFSLFFLSFLCPQLVPLCLGNQCTLTPLLSITLQLHKRHNYGYKMSFTLEEGVSVQWDWKRPWFLYWIIWYCTFCTPNHRHAPCFWLHDLFCKAVWELLPDHC